MVIHKHHIIENRDGQRFRTDITIPLSVEGHADIHKRYWEKWGFHEDYVAWKTLSGQLGKEELFIETSRIGGLNNKGKKKTREHTEKISQSNKGKKSHWSGGDIEQKKNNLSNSMKGNTNSKNHNTEKYSKTQSEAKKKAWERRKNKEKTFNHNFW